MFLCKSIGIYGTVQNTRSQIFTLFNITLDLGASPLIVKKLWQQQQLSWSQKLQILFPTWFPEVHMHISNSICKSSYAHFKKYLQLSNQLLISVHDKTFKFYELTFTGCGSARISNQSCWQEAILTATLGTYPQLRTA